MLLPEPETPMTTRQVAAMSLLVVACAAERQPFPTKPNTVHMFAGHESEATVRSPDSAFHPEGAQPVRSPNTRGHTRNAPSHAAHGATPLTAAACLGDDTAFRLV
ncbi:hypothetical protein GCM10009830_16760 [Glycomyces endophyticus]|uniref:Secreted protein n=1 Tax=Glycomyces endophyticus TaxID=480996 RepID=A0ABN2GHJ4_9ACTN